MGNPATILVFVSVLTTGTLTGEPVNDEVLLRCGEDGCISGISLGHAVFHEL